MKRGRKKSRSKILAKLKNHADLDLALGTLAAMNGDQMSADRHLSRWVSRMAVQTLNEWSALAELDEVNQQLRTPG